MTVTQGWFPVVSRLIDLLLEQEVSRGGQVYPALITASGMPGGRLLATLSLSRPRGSVCEV